MATQKPISTISYNSEAFLREQLEVWYSNHIIQAYQYICHKGEDGDKDHIHLRIEPNRKLDPMDLSEKLREFDPKHPTKPLCVRPWRPSKEEDWYLYVVHDADYLKLKYKGGDKGEKLPYEWTDIKCNSNYDVEVAFIRAKATMLHTTSNIAQRVKQGEDPLDMVLTGENPYVVSSIVRLASSSDYNRVLADLSASQKSLDKLVDAVHELGYEIEVIDEDGNIRLTRRNS